MTDHINHDLRIYEEEQAKDEMLQQKANDYAVDNIEEFLTFAVGDLQEYLEDCFDEDKKLKFYKENNATDR